MFFFFDWTKTAGLFVYALQAVEGDVLNYGFVEMFSWFFFAVWLQYMTSQ